jgi:hypothetical protein
MEIILTPDPAAASREAARFLAALNRKKPEAGKGVSCSLRRLWKPDARPLHPMTSGTQGGVSIGAESHSRGNLEGDLR